MIIIKEQVRRCDDNGKCREKEDGKSAVFALVAHMANTGVCAAGAHSADKACD